MLLSKTNGLRAALFCAAISLATAGCQVRPLYSDSAPNAAGVTTNAALNSIAIKDVDINTSSAQFLSVGIQPR